ncbi:RtcB family protein [Pseudoclavibacter chungangensis]|uniref:3'-phosphate/5'-hydroxy nucleic acid ligase n=1 Tax=Pseudoclavibacter chungangensis TaxID=587635 RepID=A0A7J5C1D7_9MICO|nr:RtcB family protein [Pseudoclavibacter chungangensis]KAB1662438.1 RtcB family protein [Pseudoclavibacter chungangensis]NYJ68469.1 tRNA-splicing ligase RtcB [Pseudoclavibacter chungangensis]
MSDELPVRLAGARAPTLMWAAENEIEQAALAQLRNIAALEWVHGVRVMPDVHLGKGATVGSVIAMERAVSPAAVGVDIGCGVAAVRTSLVADDLERMPVLRSAVEQTIPVGFRGHDDPVDVRPLRLDRGSAAFWGRFGELAPSVQRLESKAHHQLGTLGGGNHFLEVTVSSEDASVWLTLHSGSRNIGKELAERHITVARGLPHNQDLPDRDLAVFLRDTPEMATYRHDLDWAQEYAMRSRAVMMELFKGVVERHFEAASVRFGETISVHHNYVSEEIVDGRPMLVTRKGAIRAGAGELALVPGSMGTGSYIVRGLGNPASFSSASHGAGRRMSRNAARRAFGGTDEGASEIAAQLGTVESRRDAGILDELPGAYKDLHHVIASQRDLVEVVAHLQTVLCVKG